MKTSRIAFDLAYKSSPVLTALICILTLANGLFPSTLVWIGKLIIDSILQNQKTSSSWIDLLQSEAVWLVYAEGLFTILYFGTQKLYNIAYTLLRIRLGQEVNERILSKAIRLELTQFEDSETYDKMTQARTEASSKPLSMVTRFFTIAQSSITIISFFGLLIKLSPLASLILVIAAIPSFIAETKFSNHSFRLFRWKAKETREQVYLETLMAREDNAKEILLFDLGKEFLNRYKENFQKIYSEDKKLTIRKGMFSFLLGLLSQFAFYGSYVWIVCLALVHKISLGEMTMYLVIFRQGQNTFSNALSAFGGIYEDHLYIENLMEFLDLPILNRYGNKKGNHHKTGIVFDSVSFLYPGAKEPSLSNVSFELKAEEKLAIVGENGSGKTTLIKLLTRLYSPTSGNIYLDGINLEDWDEESLRRRFGVIFQNFVQYQFKVGENIGMGDVQKIQSETEWISAAKLGMAHDFVTRLEKGYSTRLGKWFQDGRELSGGQWQKVALSRAFMRTNADILILDEPTSAIDAEAEMKVFEHFREHTQGKTVILISHRFSTVRMADQILVLEQGKKTEWGSHEELLLNKGKYEKLFRLQQAGYQ
ncbi:ABC transporter ATP-binding protein/permease [Leptospira sp. 2 VSF19]|uniref:ABC transporter ATP-binding protein/permease n=1 Tax=Leptospira soteropolitanensis TaxID=2950025 RepID=A0AAW5VF59_9LEPT|nr:ABC transporter ATP-binding protein [Leptospira soteropolitanensis]MCW7493796.1 ABC transporter ATP-binding protein/permease [Leptospira soteropolitanensis]MCW7501393.1 ABC transporter ATP-binding protein/permease [Leptospira soteropolitanensis]MCW7523421.1 ABC transporter ATP-binding protein/permease [Leptospira soteropolitanensis]MCW7527507.1 ABC transporter ATP-binding protein/permease [Leptospira soteropolitanensis]MCW7531363.1 ABC transporter ATP-binding protein/permease [Leptospira so